MSDALASEQREKTNARREKSNWFIGLAVTFVFAWGNYWLSHTPVGHWLEFKAYTFLHPALPDLEKNMPVVIVDISAIPFDPARPTSRAILQDVVRQIVAREGQKPAAIGIDIDFSPFTNQPLSKEEQDFFDFCNDIRHGIDEKGAQREKVPIFLGVARTAYNDPDEWFNRHDCLEMAANISVDPEDTHQTTRWTYDKEGAVYGKQKRLLSMGQALAQAYDKDHGNKVMGPGSLAFCVEIIPCDPAAQPQTLVGGEQEEREVTFPHTEKQIQGERREAEKPIQFVEGLSLLNYSKLDQMREQHNPVEIREGKPSVTGDFGGKIVLLGNTNAADVFTIPGPLKPLKGVYIHACAADTFLREPLYTLTHRCRFWLDVLLSIALIILLAIVDAKARDHSRRQYFKNMALYSLLVLVLIAGLILVRSTGIMWFDFIAIVAALWIHPAVDEIVEEKVKHVRKWQKKERTDQQQPTVPDAGGEQ